MIVVPIYLVFWYTYFISELSYKMIVVPLLEYCNCTMKIVTIVLPIGNRLSMTKLSISAALIVTLTKCVTQHCIIQFRLCRALFC